MPVFIYGLDNSVFMATTAEGGLLSISRSAEDNKFHVKDDMTVVPYSLLDVTVSELDRFIIIY